MTHKEWFDKQNFKSIDHPTNLYYNLTRKGWDAALQSSGAVANEPPTRPAVKLPEFEEALNNSIPIRGSYDCEMLVNGAKLMYDYIRQLQA
jgi:hypothetical protein